MGAESHADRLDLVRDALSLAGHGLHPDDALILARHHLNVPLLPGSVVTPAMVKAAEEKVARAREWYENTRAASDEEQR